MNILPDRIEAAVYRNGDIIITTAGNGQIRFPVAENPRLAKGSEKQLKNIEISPFGLHWPELDEDLSLRGILKGDYGQNVPSAEAADSPTKLSR